MICRKFKFKRNIPIKYDTLEDYFLNNPRMVKALYKALKKENKRLKRCFNV